MNTLRMRVTAVAIAIAATVAGLAPAEAFPLIPAPAQAMGTAAANPITDVQYRPGWHSGPGWYNGHRGYRYHRPGYRRHNGFWFPLAAFGAGAIIGGAIAGSHHGSVSRHVAWCESRYRTYRASDDTYAPRVGVRARCVSPY